MSPVVLVIVGIVALIIGSEFVVRGSSALARRLRIPSLVIGLTVVSIGTSTPELAVGIQSGAQGVGELAVGTVAGTNVVNLLLVLGLSALIRPLAIRRQTLKLDLPLMGITAVVVVLMGLDGVLSGLDGVLLLAIAVLYTGLILYQAWRGRQSSSNGDDGSGVGDTGDETDDGEDSTADESDSDDSDDSNGEDRGGRGVLLEVLMLVGGIAVIVLGADWLVDGSVDLARRFGISEALIGLTVVAIGTSAPEIATTIVSTIRNDRDVAIGNLIGSSVYNIALILGVTALAALPEGVQLSASLVRVDLPVMAAVALLCIPVFITGRRVSRVEGGLFVAAYAVYLGYLISTAL